VSSAATSGLYAWQNGGVVRRRVSLEVEDNLAEAARLVAERAGVPEDELYERALREVLVRDFRELMDEVAAFQAAAGLELSDQDALDLATGELEAVRAERRNAS
jgi:hypothetical protein